LARPFLCIAKAIIYVEHAKIVFFIKDKKKKFSFKERILHSPTLPQKEFMPEKPAAPVPKKKNFRNQRKTKLCKIPEETVKMINTIKTEYDHLLSPPFQVKKDDPGVPTIKCTINQEIFHKTFCNMGSGVNIMSKVTYEYLFGNEPLYPTYVQLQMVNQLIRFPEGIARDVMVKIQDHFIPTDFMVLDMGDEEEDTPIILGRPFLNTTNAIIYIGSRQIHFQVPDGKVHRHFNSYTNNEQSKKPHNNRR
jgi:hypothetical protein